jgi:SAM-dependent methyltransferase
VRPETIDAWLHERMLQLLRPIVANFRDARWLTIGDEGADGWMLRRYGAAAVSASSISDARLRTARELGHLDGIEVRTLNAEHLDAADCSFDFILCRQAYHHFRRPPLAFYEFIRVARVGFVLMEPIELPFKRPLDAVRTLAKMLLRRRRPEYDLFEPAGNYIYRVSERDIFRMLAAIQLPWFAIKTFSGFYLPSLARQRQASAAGIITSLGIAVQDLLSFCRLMSPAMGVVVVPTAAPAAELAESLRAAQFRIVPIPTNPYLLS